MNQTKNTALNPIFSKLNKLFIQPKSDSNPKIHTFQSLPLTYSVKLNQKHHNSQINHRNVSFGQIPPQIKEIMVTAETQPSSVFLHTNPSSLFSKSHTNLFHFSTIQNKENDPLAADNVQRQTKTFQSYQSEKPMISYKNKHKKSMINLSGNEKNQKYYYENHKLKKLKKPHLKIVPNKIPQENSLEESLQNDQYQTDSLIEPSISSLPENSLAQIPQKTVQQCPEWATLEMQQLRQKLQYHQKMQEFYLSQIENYREDKQNLEWKLKLIVDELLFVTMKDKFLRTSGMKASKDMDFLKQSKQIIMSKISGMNLSQHINEILNQNKENFGLANSLKKSLASKENSGIFDLERFQLPDSLLHPGKQRELRSAVDLQTSSQYISSFVLENVTLVESEDEDENSTYQKHQKVHPKVLRERIMESTQSESLGNPQCLQFI